MATVSWSTPGSADTLVASASLNAIADAAGVIGAEIDNSSDKKLYMDVELAFDTATGSGTDAYVGIYLIPAPDGTNYPTPPGTGGTASHVSPTYWKGTILAVDQGGTARQLTRGVLTKIDIPPTKFRIVVVNQLNAAFPANNNSTCKGFRYGETVA